MRGLFGERDRGEAAAVIGFAAQAGAPVAEEQRLLGGGVVRCALDPGEAEPRQAARDVAPEVEAEMTLPRSRLEKAAATRIGGGESGGKFGPDLVRSLADARADPGADPFGPRSEGRHCRDSRL